MLFCSSVATAGSVIPAGAASESAACEGCRRFENRSKTATAPAAHKPEMMAINKIWRAESLYIKPLPSLTMMYGNLMPGSKMPQPQMFVVPKQLLAGLGNDKFRTERLRPQGTKTKFYLA